MRSLRARTVPGDRLATGLVALAATLTVAGCGSLAPSEDAEPGPPRISPTPLPEVAAAMINSNDDPRETLDACRLLDLSTEEIVELTEARMPLVEPTGSGDLNMICTYGGPGSAERAESGDSDDEDGQDDDDTTTATSTTATSTTGTSTTATSTSTATTSPAVDPDVVPDTFAAGVVKPRDGAEQALSEQARLLSNRFSCSEVRGPDPAGGSASESATPGDPEAPAVVRPTPETEYIDCTAAPTGGGIEVHTILVADNDLWHLVLIKPETPRSPERDAEALSGLHRVAAEILD